MSLENSELYESGFVRNLFDEMAGTYDKVPMNNKFFQQAGLNVSDKKYFYSCATGITGSRPFL